MLGLIRGYEDIRMLSFFNQALAHCENLATASGPILSVTVALFLSGLVGGFTHCAFMCGPFVLAQTTRRLESVPAQAMSESVRFRSALLLPYHAGRITTYIALGALAGGLVGGLSAGWAAVSGVLLLTAGLALVASALPVRWPGLRLPTGLLRFQTALLHFVAPLSLSPFGVRGFTLGLVLGLLPCPMIWSGLLAAAGTGSFAKGGLAMMALGLGTVPGLFVAALAGRSFFRALQLRAGSAARVATALAGVWLCIVSIGFLAGS